MVKPPPPPRSPGARRKRVGSCLLFTLTVLVPSAAMAWPLAAVLSVMPLVGFVALPSLLGLTVFLLYAVAWIAYLALAQWDPPTSSSDAVDDHLPPSTGNLTGGPFLPWSPTRCWKVDRAVARFLKDAWRLGLLELWFDWAYRRLMILGGRHSKDIITEGVHYGSRSSQLLDVYMPPPGLTTSSVDDHDASSTRAPIIVFVPGGGWMTSKRYASPLSPLPAPFNGSPERNIFSCMYPGNTMSNWLYDFAKHWVQPSSCQT